MLTYLPDDPDFPSHKANHRQYLADESKFKEVVKIENSEIKKKIHYTYRLQYLKDVVLARILDDPTFSVLNSLIFFHQVDIVNHLQTNAAFQAELFGIFGPQETNQQRKKDAVLFIQNCCAVAKNIQAQARATLFQNFINGGLLNVVTYSLRHHDAAVRVAGTDILVALIDHDPSMMRQYIFKSMNDKSKPLTDTLIELLLVEVDLGVKAQMADAVKVLLDPNANSASMDMLSRTNGDFLAKMRANPNAGLMDNFVQNFYDDSAKKLFEPLKQLEFRPSLDNLTIQEASLFTHLVEILCFFIRQHSFRSKFFTLTENLHQRVAQLMSCPQKHLKLSTSAYYYRDGCREYTDCLTAALKWFRTCIGLQDEFHNRQIITNRLFEPILGIVYETMPRDNLLNSACLELFEFITRENVKQLILHLVETYRERLLEITYVPTFHRLVNRYDQMQSGYNPTGDETSFSTQGADTPNKGVINGGQRWQGLKDADAEEEAYFNTSDGEDEEEALPTAPVVKSTVNGNSPARPLVAYPDDDEDAMDVLQASPSGPAANQENKDPAAEAEEPSPARNRTPVASRSPPERLSEKRRREEDEDEGLDSLAGVAAKRRNSVATSGAGSPKGEVEEKEKEKDKDKEKERAQNGPALRRKGSLRSKDGAQKGINLGSIALSLKPSSGSEDEGKG